MSLASSRAFTLIDVLMGILIVTMTVVAIVPMTTRAGETSERTQADMDAWNVLCAEPVPSTPSGERPLSKPINCTLRWDSHVVLCAGPAPQTPASASVLRICIFDAQGNIRGERVVPLLER